MRETRPRTPRWLESYAALATILLVLLALGAFGRAGQQRQKFTEIDVERINVVEPDGKLRLVIANRPRSIGPIYKGTPFGYPGGSRPGIIFFNDEGTENGGLSVSGRMEHGRYRASAQLAFDQFDQDQILYLNYSDDNGTRQMGLHVVDRADVDIFEFVRQRDSINELPDSAARARALRRLAAPRDGVPIRAERLFAGRDPRKAAVIDLSDRQGRPRLRLIVDSLGAAHLDFLDERGRVTYRLPDSARTGRR